MIRLAANYVVDESGKLLKNGILIAEDDGAVLEYIDTLGNLREIAHLTFCNGILMAGFGFERTRASSSAEDSNHLFSSLILPEIAAKQQLPIQSWLDLCKRISIDFPEAGLIEIFRDVTSFICAEGGFQKETQPGVYLLTGSDLLVLKLGPNSKLKRLV